MNTSKPIEITYTWDRENFEKSFESAYNYHYKNSLRRYIGWFFVAMAQFGVVAALKGGSVALLMFSTILLLYWYVLKKRLLKKRALKNFENSPFKEKTIKMQVNQAGIKLEDGWIPWEQIAGVVPAEEGIMIYQEGKEFYIPPNAFTSVEERSRFKTIAKEKGKLYV